MAPPGGASSIVFGASEVPGLPSGNRRGAGANAPGSISQGNNYARPGGQQNVSADGSGCWVARGELRKSMTILACDGLL